MERQLDLLPPPAVDDDWRIDEETKAIGRRGLARARAALAEARARVEAQSDDHHHAHPSAA